jgi:hypothetical protein
MPYIDRFLGNATADRHGKNTVRMARFCAVTCAKVTDLYIFTYHRVNFL